MIFDCTNGPIIYPAPVLLSSPGAGDPASRPARPFRYNCLWVRPIRCTRKCPMPIPDANAERRRQPPGEAVNQDASGLLLSRRKPRAWTKGEIRRALALREAGHTRSATAGKLGRPRDSVNTLFNRLLHAGQARFLRRYWSSREDAVLCGDSSPVRALASRLRRTASAVQSRRRALGLHVRPRWTEKDIQAAIALRAEGLRCGEIGARLNRSAASLEGLFHKLILAKRIAPMSRREIALIGSRLGAPHIRNLWSAGDNEKLLSLRAEGRLVREIAVLLGKTQSSVGGHLHTLRRAARRRAAGSGTPPA
jgi:hypothetical protein